MKNLVRLAWFSDRTLHSEEELLANQQFEISDPDLRDYSPGQGRVGDISSLV